MNAATYRLASGIARTVGQSFRPATHVSVSQRIQQRSFSSAQRLSQSAYHAPKAKPDDTIMWTTFGTVGVSTVLGMWYIVGDPPHKKVIAG